MKANNQGKNFMKDVALCAMEDAMSNDTVMQGSQDKQLWQVRNKFISIILYNTIFFPAYEQSDKRPKKKK
jgi:hypothetical protein